MMKTKEPGASYQHKLPFAPFWTFPAAIRPGRNALLDGHRVVLLSGLQMTKGDVIYGVIPASVC